MKSLHIRDLDEGVLQRLRKRAKHHHRSLQGELRAILEDAARYAPDDETLDDLELITVDTGNSHSLTREEIYGDDGR